MSLIKKLHKKVEMPSATEALPGRSESIPTAELHYVNKIKLNSLYPNIMEVAMFGLGCFWGAEKKFWQTQGVFVTAAGYAAGYTPNPTYEEVCSGQTGHNEVVRVVFDPNVITYKELLKIFWESHNPTQGMQQGNDVGTQYRSGIYVYSEQQRLQAEASRNHFQQKLIEARAGNITTEIIEAPEFYFAEDYHQQYLAKNPTGYCGLGGTGVTY